jgi:integrase
MDPMMDERSSALAAPAGGGLGELHGEAERYLRQAHAEHTRRAYQSDWRRFEGWCEQRGVVACPASVETVLLFLTEEARTHKVSTLRRRLSSLTRVHRAAGWESPAEAPRVRLLLSGIRREKGSASEGRKALLVADLEAMLEALPAGLLGVRDRALLLTGFAGAFRRSELVGLDWRDLEFREAGVVVTLRRSKTDPGGEGRSVAIPRSAKASRCPVRALLEWRAGCGLDESGSGPVFRPMGPGERPRLARLSDKAVARVIKRSLEACGRDASEYSGHSLRAGFATAAAMGGAPEHLIMNQTGHRSAASLRRYIREAGLFVRNAGDYTGL